MSRYVSVYTFQPNDLSKQVKTFCYVIFTALCFMEGNRLFS